MSKLKKSRKKEIRERVRHLAAEKLEQGLPEIDNFVTGEDEAEYADIYLAFLAESIRPRAEETTNEEVQDESE